MSKIESVRRDGISEKLEAARARDWHPTSFIGHAELYCDEPACALREVTVHIKEFYPEERIGIDLVCPACKNQLKAHWVLTGGEFDEREQEHARASVNYQIRVAADCRSEGGEHPLGGLLSFDTRLPGPGCAHYPGTDSVTE